MTWKWMCLALTADVLHLSAIHRPFDVTNSSNSRFLHEKNTLDDHHHHHHPRRSGGLVTNRP
jgi:hypothetical protein